MRKISTHEEMLLLDQTKLLRQYKLVTLNNFPLIALPCAGDISYEGVPYQLSTVI